MRTLSLIIKELITLLRDKQSRMVVIVPVIMQLSLFPFAATLEVTNVNIGIYNEDSGKESIELSQRIAGVKAFSHVLFFSSRAQMERSLNNQNILVALWFPPDFSQKIASKDHTSILAILDGRSSNSAQIVAGYLNSILMDYQAEVDVTTQHIPTASFALQNWYNQNLNYKWFVLPSLIALITTVGVLIFTALSVAREREQGTMDQLLVSPLSIAQIFTGKAVSALLVAMLQGTLVFSAGVWIYKVPFAGSVLLLYGCMVIYCFSLVGFGLLISSVCHTQQQAFIGVFLFMMPAILLSGYVSPVENMPQWLQIATQANPVRHFIEISKQIYLKGSGFSTIWDSLLPLLVIIATAGTGAYVLFKKNIS